MMKENQNKCNINYKDNIKHYMIYKMKNKQYKNKIMKIK
mgnify:FL=1|jgi:hypothetical protein